MKPGLLILGCILVFGLGVHQAVFHLSHAKVHAIAEGAYAELEWLRQEFAIEEAQWEQIRALHLAHDETCLAYCAEMEASNQELLQLMQESEEMTPEIESALRKATELRERCRRTTLRHIYEVSEQMSPEAGGALSRNDDETPD